MTTITTACDATPAVANEPASRFNEVFGNPSERAATKVKPFLTRYVQEFIRHSPFVVMATADAQGNCDASPKGGKPGFVKVLDDRRLLLPDVAGNKLFQSYRNMDENPHVGLVFMIPGVNDTVRVNGKVKLVNKAELEQNSVELSLYQLDDNSRHLQGIVVEVEESYGHCPRAFKFSDLWNAETITRNQKQRPIMDRTLDS